MRSFLFVCLLTTASLFAGTVEADAQIYYRGGFSGVYGPAYYNTYRPYYSYRPSYPGYQPYRAYRPVYNYYGPYPRYSGPTYFVPYRAWGAAPGGFYGGGFYLY